MLEASHVTFSYSKQEDASPALLDVSIQIAAGETVAIIGQNGSGKSTLAKLFAAILKPTTGTVQVDGLPTGASGEALWTIRQRVGIVFQNPDDQLVANTVIDDIAFGPENLGLPRFEIEERVQEVVALLELQPYLQMAVSELSVGQKQRVAIAGVLAMRPHYLILDEPTTMISGHTAHQLLDTVQRLSRERGIAIIYITHYMHEVRAFQRVIVMDEGRILMDGTPANIFTRADELRTVGLDVPLVTKLGQDLRTRGWTELPQPVLSIQELKETGASAERSEALFNPSRPAPIDRPLEHPPQSSLDPRNVVVPVTGTDIKPLFELRDVHYTYMHDTPFAVEALTGLSLSIPEGRTLALVGPTKSGKSTIVDLLAGLIKPAAGGFLFEGADVAASSFDIERIRSTVGVVFQSPEAQIFEETVGKDISFGPLRKKVSLAESRRLVKESLEAVGLPYEDFRTRYTYALSGGQKRRVAIAGVLALQPKVIIFDEPTAGLDPRGRRELLDLIGRLKQKGNLTIIYTSSSLEDVIELADTIYVLDQGRLAFSGTPQEILLHAKELAALDIAMPEVTQIALALHETIPTINTDVLSLAELEQELVASRASTRSVSTRDESVKSEATRQQQWRDQYD